MKKTILILTLLIPIFAYAKTQKVVEFSWDANTEAGTQYKIYYGKQSRFDPALDHAAIYAAVKSKYCPKYDPPQPVKTADCEKSIDDFCTDAADKLCDFDFFDYETTVDAGSALGWTYRSSVDETVYFTIVAYDPEKNESRFANEIEVKIDNTLPQGVLNFTGVMKDNVSYKVEIKREEKLK